MRSLMCSSECYSTVCTFVPVLYLTTGRSIALVLRFLVSNNGSGTNCSWSFLRPQKHQTRPIGNEHSYKRVP